jgi:hypothetical protein
MGSGTFCLGRGQGTRGDEDGKQSGSEQGHERGVPTVVVAVIPLWLSIHVVQEVTNPVYFHIISYLNLRSKGGVICASGVVAFFSY